MLMLLVGMSMIVMVFYWNQSALKPLSYVSSIFQRMPRNKLVLDVWESTVGKYVRLAAFLEICLIFLNWVSFFLVSYFRYAHDF